MAGAERSEKEDLQKAQIVIGDLMIKQRDLIEAIAKQRDVIQKQELAIRALKDSLAAKIQEEKNGKENKAGGKSDSVTQKNARNKNRPRPVN